MFLQLVFLILVNLSGVYSQGCACVTYTKNVRSGSGTGYSVLGQISSGSCLPYLGRTTVAGGFTWREVVYNNQVAWMGGSYITITSCPSGLECPPIISRAGWGARAPKSTPTSMSSAPENVFIHHTASGSCTSQSACAAKVQSFQDYHMDSNGWNDIGYSFLVGEDGNVYEGRGWMVVGAHTSGYNTNGYGFSVIGNFQNGLPNNAAQAAVRWLIACGVENGHIQSVYRLLGHRDVSSTQCPGQQLYDEIKTWPNYNSTPL